MSTEITINGWCILVLCVMYSSGAIFTGYILTFTKERWASLGWVLLGSYFWPIGLIAYLILAVGAIIKDFVVQRRKK